MIINTLTQLCLFLLGGRGGRQQLLLNFIPRKSLSFVKRQRGHHMPTTPLLRWACPCCSGWCLFGYLVVLYKVSPSTSCDIRAINEQEFKQIKQICVQVTHLRKNISKKGEGGRGGILCQGAWSKRKTTFLAPVLYRDIDPTPST